MITFHLKSDAKIDLFFVTAKFLANFFILQCNMFLIFVIMFSLKSIKIFLRESIRYSSSSSKQEV